MSLPSGIRASKPYLPMVNAMPPNAPMGASTMIMPSTLKRALRIFSNVWTSECPAAPMRETATPNSTENSSTCSRFPSANAPTTLGGTISVMCSTAVFSRLFCTYADTSPCLIRLWSRPAPGCTVLATNTPMAKASVVTDRKYSMALPPMRPNCFMSCTLPIPTTMVKKMMGAISILIRLMNVLPMASTFFRSPSVMVFRS